MEITAFVLSILALTFTIFSFWWMNWRQGELLVGAPRTYAAAAKDRKVLIEVPLLMYNTGPKPILVENMRLRFLDEEIDVPPLFFNATVEKLGTDEGRAFATQFAVPGNSTSTLICEFQERGDFAFGEGSYPLALDARLNERDWETLKEFSLNVSLATAVVLSQGTLKVSDNHA